MNIKKFLLLIVSISFLFGAFSSFAQKKNKKNDNNKAIEENAVVKNSQKTVQRTVSRPFQNIDSFYIDIQRIFSKITSPTKGFIESDFRSTWESQLSEEQKEKTFSIVRHMARRGYVAKPHIEDFLGSITAGVKSGKLDEAHLKRYLEIADTCVEMYPKHITKNLFHTTRLFLETDLLYNSKFNSLKVVGGTFEIGHVFDEHLATEAQGKFQEEASKPKEKPKEEWFEHLEGKSDTLSKKTEDDFGWGDLSDDSSSSSENEEDNGWGSWGDTSDSSSESTDNGWGSSTDSSTDDGGGWSDASDVSGWGDASDKKQDKTDENGWGDSKAAKSWEDNSNLFDLSKVEEYENKFRDIHEGIKEVTEEDLATSYDAEHEPLPEVKGPYISFDHVDLKMTSPFDSAHIDKVVGKIILKDYNFVGNGGRMFWNNVGLPEEQVYCELPSYSFNVRQPHIKADHAEMHYKEKVDTVMYGYFYYEIHSDNKKPEKAIYPRFKSYYSNIKVKDLAKDVTYVGGFSLIGKKMYSSSFSHVAASITVTKGDSIKFKAYSTSGFTFADSIISSPRSSITIYQANSDSLTHPALSIRYDANKSLLWARRDKGEYKDASFENTYHQVMLHAEYLIWDLAQDSLDLTILNARDKIPLEVRSEDYFNPYVVPKLTGMLRYNPLIIVCNYSLQKRQSIMLGYQIAKDRKLEIKGFHGAMRTLHKEGFIQYNPYTDKLIVKKKGWLYFYANQRMANPNANTIDFDNFRLTSRTSDKYNATLDFKKNELKVRGVKNFIISDSMKVIVQPLNGEVTILENRKTKFGGSMLTGNLVFRGKEFIFNYDSFLVNMAKVDSISFLVKDSTSDVAKEVPNSLTDTGGVLYIGRRNNKSGLAGTKGYPRFDADVGGTIYFDRPDILGGAYDRRIFFEVPPFKIDSLNDKGMDRSLSFKGTFNSGGIFPDFEQTLAIQRDNAFGFTQETPELGYPLFAKTAFSKYYGKITMDSRGIRGDGKIEHLAGLFFSNDFIFYPDSVHTRQGTSGIISSSIFQGTPYPSVAMSEFDMRWLVNQDSMVITVRGSKPFEMYDPNSTYMGSLVMRKNEMLGKGVFETPYSSDSSRFFSFKQTEYLSKNSTFKIKSKDPKVLGMLGKNVSVNYDLAERVAIIKGMKQGQQSFSFPYSEYVTDINTVIWSLDQGKLVMSGEGDVLGRFTSTQKQQYGLEYEASSAVYDLDDYTLRLYGVPRIKIANAHIIPDNGEVVVRKGGELDSLLNARIELNGFSKYHLFHQANLKIVSARDFRGTATYDYINDAGTKMSIKFDRFKIEYSKEVTMDKAGVDEISIKAYGSVNDKQPIKLIAGVDYAGDIKVIDKDDFLHFRGKARLEVERPNNVWFTHESSDSLSHGVITVDKNLTEAGLRNRLKTGIYLGKLSKQIYPAFIEFVKSSEEDTPILEMNGTLSFNDKTKDYIAIHKNRAIGVSMKGDKIVYNFGEKRFDFEGSLDLVKLDENEKFRLMTGAVGKIPLGTSKISMDVMIYLNFIAEASTHRALHRSFEDSKYSSDPSVTDFNTLKIKLGQLLEDNQFKKIEEDSTKSFAKFLGDGIVFSEVKMKWSNEGNAFISEGDLGLYSIFGEDIDTKTEGYIEVPKKENENTANIYFVNNSGSWFFFGIRKNNIITLSSNADYNAALAKSKSLKKAELTDVSTFVNSFRTRYLGLEPIEFTIEAASAADLGTDNTENTGTEESTESDSDFGSDTSEEGENTDNQNIEPNTNVTSDSTNVNQNPNLKKDVKTTTTDKKAKDKKDKKKKEGEAKEEEDDGDGF
jgi:hypothetical protein